ncbi:MAG: ATP-binding protein [Verrucomicrobiota bacterium]
MKTRDISPEEALSFAERSESHFYDRKALEIKPNKIEKIAVAFSNADGGEFVIGIKDDSDEADPKLRWKGANDVEDLNAHLQSLFALVPALDVRYEILTCSDHPGYCLRVQLEKNLQVCKASDGTVYARHGAQSLPIKDPDKILQLTYAKGAASFEDQDVPATKAEAIVESPVLKDFLQSYSPKTDGLDFAVNQNLLDPSSWVPRIAAIVLFHESPQANLPRKSAVRVTRYETREDDPERDHLKDSHLIEGPAYNLINEAIAKTTEIMSVVAVWKPEGIGTLDYPPEALWETVVNAVIHRDYSVSDDIQILVYDDRIEIISPGRLPGYVTIENILDARYSRNPKIVRTLSRYPDAPNKDLGEGLNTVFQKMKEWGLKPPVITEEGNTVKVILPHSPLASPGDAILTFLKNHDQITNKQARDLTGIKSENLVKVEFYKLRDAGFLEMIPELKGPKAAWRLTAKGKKAKPKNEG